MDLDTTIITAAAHAARTDATASLATLAHASALVDRLTSEYVAQARRDGRSWTQIGDCLGVSKQAAQQRYGTTRT